MTGLRGASKKESVFPLLPARENLVDPWDATPHSLELVSPGIFLLCLGEPITLRGCHPRDQPDYSLPENMTESPTFETPPKTPGDSTSKQIPEQG
jgi:hypothetical protein